MKQNRMKRNFGGLFGLALAICGAVSASAATVQNFEGALGGNESIQGDAGIRTGGYFGINDVGGGNGQLLLTTINDTSGHGDNGVTTAQNPGREATASSDANFLTFFGVTPSDNGTTGKEGSGYKIVSLSLTAGQTFSFDWDFLTQEGPDANSGNKDFAFFSLSTGAPNYQVLTDAFTTPRSSTSGGNPFGDQSGYTTRSINIATTGTYTFIIGVMDAGPSGTDSDPSALLVDNIQTGAAVPEPSTLGLMIAGAAGLAAIRRRIRK